jgi:hypothetical protein
VAAAPKPRKCFLLRDRKNLLLIPVKRGSKHSICKLFRWSLRKQSERRCQAQGFARSCVRESRLERRIAGPISAHIDVVEAQTLLRLMRSS